MKLIGIMKCFVSLLLSLFILVLGVNTLQAMDLPKVIDKTNCNQYKDLFIPAFYRAVERGEFIVTPGSLNFKYKHEDSFIAAGAKNAGKFDVNQDGDLIEKSTGKIPEYNIYGFPFPNIDPKDPIAGGKIMWNFNFQRYRLMGSRERTRLTWINTTGEERYVVGILSNLYMTGRPPGQEIKNPDNVLMYEFQNVVEPMAVRGMNTMAYLYNDSRENAGYSYIPAIRRVRRTTAATRSDPYLGSDSWMDMSNMWSGKNRSMKWKYVGEKTILVHFTSPDMIPVEQMSDGSLTRKYPYSKHLKFGYEIPGWKGAPWAPAPGTITYAPRKVWVVEQLPKDPYYNWGLHINYVDKETYIIWYKEVYDKSGQFRTWVSTLLHYSESPSGKNNLGENDAQIYVDEKVRHSTVSCRTPFPEAYIFMPASKLSPAFFKINNFLLLSK